MRKPAICLLFALLGAAVALLAVEPRGRIVPEAEPSERELEQLRSEVERLRTALVERRPQRRRSAPAAAAEPAGGPRPDPGGSSGEEGGREQAPETRAQGFEIKRRFTRVLLGSVRGDFTGLDPEPPGAEEAQRLRAVAGDTAASVVDRSRALARLGASPDGELGRVATWILERPGEPDAVRKAAFDALWRSVRAGVPVPASMEAIVWDRGSPERAAALLVLSAAGPERALPVYRSLLGSGDDGDLRLAVGGLLQERETAYLPILRELVHREPPVEGRQELLAAIAELRGPRWSAIQLTGPPDTPAAGDFPTAWASKRGDMGEVTIDVEFELSVVPELLRIHETFNPGALARVETGFGDRRVVLWEGTTGAGAAPRWIELPLTGADLAIRELRLVLDTDRVEGWNEIDAVELVGEGRRQWAAEAHASSSYADG